MDKTIRKLLDTAAELHRLQIRMHNIIVEQIKMLTRRVEALERKD